MKIDIKIYKFINKQKDWISLGEVSIKGNFNRNTVRRVTNELYKKDKLVKKKVNREVFFKTKERKQIKNFNVRNRLKDLGIESISWNVNSHYDNKVSDNGY